MRWQGQEQEQGVGGVEEPIVIIQVRHEGQWNSGKLLG